MAPGVRRGPASARRRASDYLPFLITLLAGAIVVMVVALALGNPTARRRSLTSLPAPSLSATPAAAIGPSRHHQASP